ncbi:hypothetical protein ACET3Z_002285 [Daucus carota]
MEQADKRKIARVSEEPEGGEDRISWLSTELIHEILSFVDARSAVQTSVLSKRWKLVWRTLPYVNFTNHIFPSLHNHETRGRFICNFFLRRSNLSDLLKVNFEFDNFFLTCVSKAMLNNAREVKIESLPSGFELDSYIYFMNSLSLHKLTVRPIQGELSATRCWNLPALTTLHLAAQPNHRILLPEWYLLCLPALRTLVLEGFQSPDPISLPALTTLHLTNCILPQNSWDFPALLTLKLDAVSFPESSNGDEPLASLEEFKLYYTRVVYIFPGLSNAKILTLDSATVQALSAVSKLLVQVPSPFYQLKHVKVPQGHKDSSISADLKRYLLGRSPEATIVTKLPQSEVLVAPPPAAVKPQAVVKPPRVEEHNLGAAMGLLFPLSFVKFKVSELENVNIKLRGGNGDEPLASWEELKNYYTRVIYMFPGLSSAKTRTLDSETN